MLEGNKDKVIKLYDKICLDERHGCAIFIIDGEDDKRQFH